MPLHAVQLPLEITLARPRADEVSASKKRLVDLLTGDLDYHNEPSDIASHNMHSFPAKYPPQLPRTFIEALTAPGNRVLDPMMGSGTTLVEAYLAGRQAVGFDIDPLAVTLARTKVTPLDAAAVHDIGAMILGRAQRAVSEQAAELDAEMQSRYDAASLRFIRYWFHAQTQLALYALIREIERIEDDALRSFFEIALSACIITKSGGVSLAFDLAHTRPHRAKIVYDEAGRVIVGEQRLGDDSPRVKLLTKRLHSPLDEFAKRVEKNLLSLPSQCAAGAAALIAHGDAQRLPLSDASIDLIVTSPPYAANAIDYMRAHKFSLVWLGFPVDALGERRGDYIGGEAVNQACFEALPRRTSEMVERLAAADARKGLVLHRYYSEMTRVLREMHRVLKPGKAAIVVVGSSTMRGQDTETGACLAEIGQALGLETSGIGVRNIDRNRRMMPAGAHVDRASQIQQRMHQEYVIAFLKPGGPHA